VPYKRSAARRGEGTGGGDKGCKAKTVHDVASSETLGANVAQAGGAGNWNAKKKKKRPRLKKREKL